jgi:hypothetical protein
MIGSPGTVDAPPYFLPLANGWIMARKIVNRKEKRAEVEAAEKADKKGTATKTKKAAAPKAAPKRKSRAKAAKDIRLKAFWGVFNQTLKRIALFEYSERKKADKMAAELTANGKSPHFVQLVKDVVQE